MAHQPTRAVLCLGHRPGGLLLERVACHVTVAQVGMKIWLKNDNVFKCYRTCVVAVRLALQTIRQILCGT